jgi:hypothetical protein
MKNRGFQTGVALQNDTTGNDNVAHCKIVITKSLDGLQQGGSVQL